MDKTSLKDLVKFLLRMSKKMGDRDNNICMALTFENIEEYFVQYKTFIGFANFSHEDKLLKGIIRSFVMAQLSCITHDKEERFVEPFRDMLYEVVESDFDEFKELMVLHWKMLLNDISTMHNRKLW